MYSWCFLFCASVNHTEQSDPTEDSSSSSIPLLACFLLVKAQTETQASFTQDNSREPCHNIVPSEIESMSGGKGSFWIGVLCGVTASVVAISCTSQGSRERKPKEASDFKDRSMMQSPRGFGFLRQRNLKESSFLTDVMEKLWPYVKIAGAETIRASVEPSFAELPGPMKTCRFTKLDLGNVPMRMDNIVVHPLQPDGSVQFDMDLEWDGECNFQLKADYVGTFGVRHLKLSGRMAIILKPLTNQLPIVSGIQYGFINMPIIKLSFSGLASVADLSILETTVQEAIQSSLSTTVLPYRRLYKMNAANNFLDTYQPPVGVLRLTVLHGKGFVIEKRFLAKDDIPDVYLNISVGQEGMWRTKTVMDDLNPVWRETGDFCLYDREQVVHIHAWDEDDGPLDPDDDLGTAMVTVADMLLAPRRTIKLPLLMFDKTNNKEERTGASVTLSCDICEWTSDLSSLSATQSVNAPHTELCGLLVVIVNRAFDIPLDAKTASTFVKVTYAGKEYDSKMIYSYPGWDPLNPIYDTAFTIPINTEMPRDDKTTIKLDLINLSSNNSIILGSHIVSFAELKEKSNNTLTERHAIGDRASLEYRISLSGVEEPSAIPQLRSRSPGAPSDTALQRSPSLMNDNHVSFELDEIPSAGTFELTVVKARGLKIREELFGFDVPDVYFEVDFENDTFTTSVKHNNVTPEWNESKKWVLVDHSQKVLIKGWDKNERKEDQDVPIGVVSTTIGNLLLAGRSVDLELMDATAYPSGVFVSLRARMI